MDNSFDFNPMLGRDRQNPYLFYAEARELPVAFSPSIGAFMVSRYADLQTVLDDPATYSSRAALPTSYGVSPELDAELRRGNVPETAMVVNDDGETHRWTRRVMDAAFTGARVRALGPLMRSRAAELIAGLPSGGAELVADYAAPFVRTIIQAAIGLPEADTAQLQVWSDEQVVAINPLAPMEDRIEAARQLGEYTRYLQVLIDERRQHPRDDLISDLIHGGNGLPGLDDDRVHSIIRAVRVAGFDTTRDAITMTLFSLLQDREAYDRVVADPARNLSKLVQEVLRREAPHRGLFRLVTRDTELGGTALTAGSVLLLLFGSGNRDETVFADPDRLDLDRANAHKHLAFGQGLHVCPGEPVARAEIRVAVETLLTARPGLRLAPEYTPTYIASYLFRGLERLDVTWNRVAQDNAAQPSNI
ncbi:cytochrome P450 [Deinococcus sp.]|uniref:cytochrome P450 n=1 Tax=Deinococcus sp. TaxID=47478 RepID=UPI003B59A07D